MSNITKQTSNITNITKQRVKLNIKVLGVQLARNNQDASGAQAMPEKPTFREQFTAPEMSIISKLMAKVSIKYLTLNKKRWLLVSTLFNILSRIHVLSFVA